MKKPKKLLSFFLVLTALFAVVAAAPFQVNAVGRSLVLVQSQGGTIVRENYQQDDWDHTVYEAGTRIMLSVSPEEGYDFSRWDVHFQNNDPVEVNKGAGRFYYFDIPEDSEEKGPIIISALFVGQQPREEYHVSIVPNYEGGTENTVKLGNGVDSDFFLPGDTVTVNIDWKPGTRFRQADGDDPDQYKLHARYQNGNEQVDIPLDPSVAQDDHADKYTFVMPSAEVSITCEFEYAYYDVTYEYVADEGVDPSGMKDPYYVIDGETYVQNPLRIYAERAVDFNCPVDRYPSGVCCSAVDMEYTDAEGNHITKTLPVESNTDGHHSLHANFDMPYSNVKLKLRVGNLYHVKVSPLLGNLIIPDPDYAMEGDTVSLSVSEDDNIVIDQIQVKDSQNNNIPLNDANEFTMPADNVTVTARIREKYIERSWDGEKALEIDKNSAAYGKEYYIREEMPPGYTAEYTGKNNWDVVNTKTDSPTEPTVAPTDPPSPDPTAPPTPTPTQSPTDPGGDGSGKLKITATRPDAAKAKEQSYVYEVAGPENIRLTVAIVLKAGETTNSAVISHIPIGSYTVTEGHAWSWRYSDGKNKTASVTADNTSEAVFDHTLDLAAWLNGYSHRVY